MSYYCFVQARYSSKRLRGKVLKKIGKFTLLEILLKRLKKSKQINKIVVLTSNSNQDKKIIDLCKRNKIDYFSGPLKNVFLRFKYAIKKYRSQKIVRICADSPLMDWRLIDKMINLSKSFTSYDIISNVKTRTFPKGQSIEILRSEIFDVSSNLLTRDEKEHVTKFFYDKKKYKIFNYKSNKKLNKYNLCVDDHNDYLVVSKLIKKKSIFATWKSYVKEL
jgi:spore coat polysaccharide biosynthesis protein SpsF|tara:strand:- start:8083 stop:8742 length:660 start_codon:yes stop_codon:yes gene_type:complete